jgi:hypothetical protein
MRMVHNHQNNFIRVLCALDPDQTGAGPTLDPVPSPGMRCLARLGSGDSTNG